MDMADKAQKKDTVLVKERDVMNLYKRKSETPLQTIERYVAAYPNYKGKKMTYAGRLDPMAEGVLIVLAGEKTKERDKYTGLDKDYEFEFVLGIETDTFDVLGKIVSTKNEVSVDIKEVQNVAEKYKGKIQQAYPAYSSKVIDGTPMFQLAREGKIADVILPTHEVIVSNLEIVGERIVSKEEFEKEVVAGITSVIGDFRQEEILERWKNYFTDTASSKIKILKGKLSCGSGFYVRQLVADMGKDLGVGAVTTNIVRTRVGTFIIKDSFSF